MTENTEKTAKKSSVMKSAATLSLVVSVTVIITLIAIYSTNEPEVLPESDFGESESQNTTPAESPFVEQMLLDSSATEFPSAGQSPVRTLPTIQLPTSPLPATVDSLVDEAKDAASRLRELCSDSPESLHVAAMLHSQIRESAEAERLWSRCIELDPKQVSYYVNLSAIAMDRGDSELAVETLEKAISEGCESPDVYHHLAVAQMNLGRAEEAETLVLRTLEDHPDASSHWLVLGQAQLRLGNAADAEVSLRKAIELGSGSPNAYFALANACSRLGKQEEATAAREIFVDLKASEPIDKQDRYDILATAEAQRTAITTFCEAASVHMKQENRLETEMLLLRAVSIQPLNMTPYVMLEQLYREAGMYAEQRVVLERLTQLNPTNHVNYYYIAMASLALNEPEAAEAALKTAITIKPLSAEPYATIAQFYLETDRVPKARWFAAEANRREPTPDGYQFLAVVCDMLDDTEGAAEARAEAARLMEETNP